MDTLKSMAARVITAGALLLWGQSAVAVTYYVATSGSDSNAGTLASPFATVQKGVNAAHAGDVIIVRDGTYGPTGGSGSYGASINTAGTSSAWITLKAENKGKAILDCQMICHSYINFQTSAAYWVIQGFDVRNGYWAGIFSNHLGGKNIKILGNHVHHIGNRSDSTETGICGIYTDAGALNWTIDGNVINDVGRTNSYVNSKDHCIYSHGSSMLITNNVTYNPVGYHIQTAAGFSGTIANNTFLGPNLYAGKPGVIMLWDVNSNVIIRNNIFYNPRTSALNNYASSISGTCTFDNNIVYNSATSVTVGPLASGCVQSNNRLNVNPLLVNPVLPSWDLHLQAASPAINTAVAVPGVTTDFDGNARPQGGAYDLGAFEYGGTITPPPGDTTAPVISAVAATGMTQTGATIGWTTDETSDTQVEYGPSAAYGASTVLNATRSTSHSAVLGGLASGTLYHYRVKSKDAAGNLATSVDATCTTAAPLPVGSCITSAGAWTNAALTAQSGAFTVEFDAVPGMAKMDGSSGLSNAAASAYPSLAAAVRFNAAGTIDARNGGAYAAAVSIPYSAGLTYHIRLVVSVAAHTYSAYVKQGGNAEQLLGSNYAFRTEQNTVKSLNNLGLYALTGSEAVCNAAVTASASTATVAGPVISAVTASGITQTGATIAWTTNVAADTQVEYGPTTAYGASTALNATLATSHKAAIGGLTSGALYHYRVKSKDSAGRLTTSVDASFTTAAPLPPGACINTAGAWTNAALTPQTGSFTVEYDAVPGMAKMDGVSGVSNSAAAAFTSLAAIVRFNNAGFIDARNDGNYAAAASIAYAAGATYHIRMAVNIPNHTYSAYVKVGSNPEQLLGGGYAFRTEQAAVATLNNLGTSTTSGSMAVCNTVVK